MHRPTIQVEVPIQEPSVAKPSGRKPRYVYVLLCRGGRVYTGVTPDLLRRMRQHRAARGAKFTRAHPPEALLAAKAFPTASEALSVERQIKRMRAPTKHVLAKTWAGEFELGPELRAVFDDPSRDGHQAELDTSRAS